MEKKNSLKTLKTLLILIDRYKIDQLTFNGIEIKKTRHVMPEVKDTSPGNTYNTEPTTIDELDAEIARMTRMSN